ncbi:MAG: GTP-binding protein [Promethearchaeota archaeon]
MDDSEVIKRELSRCKGEFLKLFKKSFGPKFEEGIFENFDLFIDSIQRSLPPIISLVGYTGVGKTTITELIRTKEISLQQNEKVSGNVATLKIGNIHFLLRDFTGQDQFIFLWKNFLKGSNVVILIVDSTLENIEKSKMFLKLIKEETPHANTAVIANKQDLSDVINTMRIQEILGLKTYPINATDPNNRDELIKIVIDLLQMDDRILPLLNLLFERDKLITELNELNHTIENFEHADLIFKKIINLCIQLKENPSNMDFYKYRSKIRAKLKEAEYPIEIPTSETINSTLKEPTRKISLTEKLLKTLLTEYLSNVEGILALTISDREGFIITSVSREETGDDSVLGAIAVAVDSYIERIKREFGTESNFFNITSIGDKKFAYCSMGPKSILTTMSTLSTSDTELRVFSEHIAGKIELILKGNENVSLEVPEIIKVLAKTRSGKIPIGDYTTKLILTGDYAVGKTSLIRRFVKNLFFEDYHSTVGVDISEKSIGINDDTKVKLVIWDIGGQITRMAPYRRRFYGGANCAFIVIDRTRPENLHSVDIWYNDIKNYIQKDINIIIVGTKSDLVDQIAISEEEINFVANKYGFHYILTSALTGENVNEAFIYIAYQFLTTV